MALAREVVNPLTYFLATRQSWSALDSYSRRFCSTKETCATGVWLKAKALSFCLMGRVCLQEHLVCLISRFPASVVVYPDELKMALSSGFVLVNAGTGDFRLLFWADRPLLDADFLSLPLITFTEVSAVHGDAKIRLFLWFQFERLTRKFVSRNCPWSAKAQWRTKIPADESIV